MEKKQLNVKSSSSLETFLMGKVTECGLPVLALEDRQRFVDDVVYLLDTKRNNIPFYPWKRDANTGPISTSPAPAAPLAQSLSSTSLDAYGNTLPHHASLDGIFPADFDPSREQDHGRIGITMGTQDIGDSFSDLEKEIFADMKPWGFDYIVRLKVDEYTLVKGGAEDSEEEAMSELFKYLHILADGYREMEKETG